jgi:hypothetical protein
MIVKNTFSEDGSKKIFYEVLKLARRDASSHVFVVFV